MEDKDVNENLRNKVFSSIEGLIQQLDQDLKLDKKIVFIGKNSKNIDPYNDNRGSDRLTFYIENLLKIYKLIQN